MLLLLLLPLLPLLPLPLDDPRPTMSIQGPNKVSARGRPRATVSAPAPASVMVLHTTTLDGFDTHLIGMFCMHTTPRISVRDLLATIWQHKYRQIANTGRKARQRWRRGWQCRTESIRIIIVRAHQDVLYVIFLVVILMPDDACLPS